MDTILQTVAVYAIPVLFAITLHEAAHGYVAKMLGDNTAYAQGRVSLNPARHIDPVGTVLVPLVILLTSKLFGGGFFLFGWAKPVPVKFNQLRRPKRDMLWVAAAGPGANLIMALGWIFFLKACLAVGVSEQFFYAMGQAGLWVNLSFMLLNLLPLLPLDGGRILFSLLPHKLAWRYAKLEPWGIPILLILFAFPEVRALLFSPLRPLGLAFLQLLN